MKHEMTYSIFLSRVLACVAPLMPAGSSIIRMFCGCETIVVACLDTDGAPHTLLPSADEARLYGKRAEAFSKLEIETSGITNMDSGIFACGYSTTTGEADLDISIYARNIRRWLNGQAPRKKRARVELCAAASLWAFGWNEQPRRSVPKRLGNSASACSVFWSWQEHRRIVKAAITR